MSEQQKVSENIVVQIHLMNSEIEQINLKKAILEKPPEWKITRYDAFRSKVSNWESEIKRLQDRLIGVAVDQAKQGHIPNFNRVVDPDTLEIDRDLTIANILFAIPPPPINRQPRLISGR